METILANQPGGLEISIADSSIPNIGKSVAKSKYLGKVTTMLIGAFALAINVLPNYGCSTSGDQGIRRPLIGIELPKEIEQQLMCIKISDTDRDKCECYNEHGIVVSGKCGVRITYYN